jgi:hypothetical protein
VSDPVNPAPSSSNVGIGLNDARLRYGAGHPWALDGLSMSVPMGAGWPSWVRVAQARAAWSTRSSASGP